MTTDDWVAGYQQAVSRLLATRGDFVRLEAYPDEENRYSWTEEGDYDTFHTVYGWRAWDDHLRTCGIASWDLPSVREKSLSQFEGTFMDNREEVGMEMRATCSCGQYTDKWVRWVGTLGKALEVILKGDS